MGIAYPTDIFITVENYPSEFLRTPKHFSSKAQLSPNLKTSNGLLSQRPTTFAILQFVLKVLKIVGQCPFDYERDQRGGAYSFSWTSFDVIQSFVVAIIASFGWFTFLTHHGLKKFIIFSPAYVSLLLVYVHIKPGINFLRLLLQDTPHVYAFGAAL